MPALARSRLRLAAVEASRNQRRGGRACLAGLRQCHVPSHRLQCPHVIEQEPGHRVCLDGQDLHVTVRGRCQMWLDQRAWQQKRQIGHVAGNRAHVLRQIENDETVLGKHPVLSTMAEGHAALLVDLDHEVIHAVPGNDLRRSRPRLGLGACVRQRNVAKNAGLDLGPEPGFPVPSVHLHLENAPDAVTPDREAVPGRHLRQREPAAGNPSRSSCHLQIFRQFPQFPASLLLAANTGSIGQVIGKINRP